MEASPESGRPSLGGDSRPSLPGGAGTEWQSREARPSSASAQSREPLRRSGVSSVLVVTPGLQGPSVVSTILGPLSGTLLPGASHDCRVQPWPATAALIVAEVVGTGVLALGGAFSKLGWVPGILIVVVGFIVNTFTSLLLSQVSLAYPDVVTLGDAMNRLLGRFAGYVGYGVLYAFLFVVTTNYIIVLSHAVESVVYTITVCKPIATAIGCIVLLPGNQLRTLSDLTVLSTASCLTIFATLFVCVLTLTRASGPDDAACTGKGIVGDFLEFNAAASAFVFAYSGQTIMLEMQAEMKAPEDFPKAVGASFTTLFVVYMVVSIMAYEACGVNAPDELLEALPKSWVQSLVGVMMVIHLIVSYTIVAQVLTRAICLSMVPGALEAGFAARTKWFTVSTVLMGFAYVVANLVPLFSDIVSLSGALLATQCGLTFPPLIYLAMYFKHRDVLQWNPTVCNTAAVLSVLSLVMGVYFTSVGTVSSFGVMLRHAKDGINPPFVCGGDEI